MSDFPMNEKELTKKRKRCPEKWKSNIRKRKRDQGEEYISSRNRIMPPKSIKILKDCTNCIYKCSTIITNDEQKQVFNDYYSLDKLAKKSLLLQIVNYVSLQEKGKVKIVKIQRKRRPFGIYLKLKNEKFKFAKHSSFQLLM
ncbi:hypothetical protein NQ314_017252 [Rhamnusium bicolor]|uniref:Uncharacterized protein n=1 Tax=Rhamnusium bicolor TaxID=1586634 RepID=A0AAV8WV06_9CUCU|nr:hypothetical protein NQ314_017252 [Rhamnusium bicolor]